MTTKHTPGPWIVNECTRRASASHTYRYRISVGEGRDVEDVAIVETFSQLPPEPGCENEANALLIAAAPELLAALRAIGNYATDGAQDYERMARLMVGIARAAIAKATKE